MAQRAEHGDWTDRDSIRKRAKDSVKNFLSPVSREPDAERPLSPDLVARVTEPHSPEGREVNREAGPGEENHEERLVRPTERSRINQAPSTIYPG